MNRDLAREFRRELARCVLKETFHFGMFAADFGIAAEDASQEAGRVYSHVYRTALADGEITEKEARLLQRVAERLALSPDRQRSIEKESASRLLMSKTRATEDGAERDEFDAIRRAYREHRDTLRVSPGAYPDVEALRRKLEEAQDRISAWGCLAIVMLTVVSTAVAFAVAGVLSSNVGIWTLGILVVAGMVGTIVTSAGSQGHSIEGVEVIPFRVLEVRECRSDSGTDRFYETTAGRLTSNSLVLDFNGLYVTLGIRTNVELRCVGPCRPVTTDEYWELKRFIHEERSDGGGQLLQE